MSESIEYKRLESRLIRMEKMLADTLTLIKPPAKERITEKEAITEFNVSKHILRRLRLGYTRSDGVEIPPVLVNWRHMNGRNFDYDRAELDLALRKSVI
jgi:hypothetical protein